MPHFPVLMPHAVCWAAAPALIWTMVVTNAITFLSYLSICVTLLLLAKRTGRVIARDWTFFAIGFALFIVACGATHLLEVVTTWIPVFWIDAAANIVTALLSAYVALQLIRRAHVISFGLNDYAIRLANAEDEKHQMEESLLAARKLEDWSRMSAVVTHEIANPLEAIHNLLYLIRTQENVSPDIVQMASAADQETSRVLTISRSTLSFFRQSNAPEQVDLRAAAESVRLVLQSTLAQQKIALDIRCEGDVTIEALAGEARQVLLNLVRNACEASQTAGSTVIVALIRRGGVVEITVADQGSGIPSHLLPQLFQFGRSTKGERGNGMGLWTVQHILDRHRATIDVQSTLGVGTTFTIHWPRAYQPATPNYLAASA
jgi:signal transduction histidine kinase